MTALTALVLAALAASAGPKEATDDSRAPVPEVRALWVDGFHAGIRSQAEVDELVSLATTTGFNTLIVQVRRRGDALYASAIEPPLDDPNYEPSFDGLKAVLEAGHGKGLKVHAWINAMPIWRDEPAPKDPRHVFNRHGLGLSGPEAWLTRSREGAEKFSVGYFLDPGHPAVQEHLVSVYLDIVKKYAIDGIHFDYIRYPETEERLPRGSNVGYNPVSLERFRRATGRRDTPEPGDEAWTSWRRQQVTDLVRRVSIEARAIRPALQVSAATIAWGAPPKTLADFPNVAPMQRVFQNWQSWLVEGYLDMAVPMNYARDHDPMVRDWFNGWIAWEKKNKADRYLVVGVGGYLNTPANALSQIARVRTPFGKYRADGASMYSYFRPTAVPAPSPVGGPSNAEPPSSPDRFDFLVRGAEGAGAVFTGSAAVPPMPWIEKPERGFITGSATKDGGPADGAIVSVRRAGLFQPTRRVKTDGNGWFGLTRVKPGRYRVRVLRSDNHTADSLTIEVKAGVVSRLERPLVLGAQQP